MSSTASKYGSLWSLLDVSDEALIYDMEACLRRAGCYTLDDLAFITYKDVEFSVQVKPVVVRKFKTICDYYAKGYSLKEDTTMQDVLRLMNPKAHPVAPPPMPAPPPPPVKQRRPIPVAEAVVVVVPDPPKPEKTKPPTKRLNVVIIGDCSPQGPGWEHMDHFEKIHHVRLHSIIHHGDWIGDDHDQLILRCRHKSIKLESKIDSLNVPRPSLYILGAHRLHDLFQLVDLFHTPSAILIELPGAITSKALESLQKGAQQIPIYINLGRVVAPYVQNTLDVASKLEPNVSWYARENYSVGEMAQVFGRGRLLHSTAFEELVIAVMYFGVTASSMCRFQVNPGLTERMTSGALTDYVRVAFQMTTLSGVKLSILVDRCARHRSHMGAVTDDDGRVIQQFDHVHANCDLIIKRRLVRMIMDKVTDGVLPTIRIGVEALRLAEYAETMVAKAMEPPPVEKKGLRRLFSKTSI
jgi:hypothetical protein